jgi:hypothetical protein
MRSFEKLNFIKFEARYSRDYLTEKRAKTRHAGSNALHYHLQFTCRESLPDDEREVLLELLDRLAAQAFYSTASLSFLRTTVGCAWERPVWKAQKKKERKEGKGFWVKRKSLSMGSKT